MKIIFWLDDENEQLPGLGACVGYTWIYNNLCNIIFSTSVWYFFLLVFIIILISCAMHGIVLYIVHTNLENVLPS